MRTQPFELSLNENVYFGDYCIENGKLGISNVYTFDDNGFGIFVNLPPDKELLGSIHQLLTEEKKDEIEAEIEDDKASNQSFLINKY